MKNLAYSILSFLFITLVGSCSKDESLGEEMFKFAATTDACDSIVIVPLNLIDYYSDPFEVVAASVSSNTLTLAVEYGGGCGEVDFSLLVDNSFMESNPVQVQVIPVLQDHDKCKKLVAREICFDLTELADRYKSAYQTSSGSILIRVPGQPSVLYTF